MMMNKHMHCRQHDLDKIWFCMTEGCLKAICPECYIEGHIGHKKILVKTAYQNGKLEVAEAMETLDSKISEF